jgi:hypothetical protein
MKHKSHVDIDKIDMLPEGQHFEYRDVVRDDLPDEKHAEDGALFNKEVENGIFPSIKISNEDINRVRYKKL